MPSRPVLTINWPSFPTYYKYTERARTGNACSKLTLILNILQYFQWSCAVRHFVTRQSTAHEVAAKCLRSLNLNTPVTNPWHTLKKTNRTGLHRADIQDCKSNAGKGKPSRCTETHQASIEWELCTLSVDVNQPERETGNSSVSATDFKNPGPILHSPHTSSRFGALFSEARISASL